jgi:hypothetical protein
MKRTNIYLQDDELRTLKHIAVEEGLSFTELVRRALAAFSDAYRKHGGPPWEERLDELLTRVRERTEPYGADETEREISAASTEVRSQRKHASRRR